IGLVVIVGIVVNDGIIKIDFIRRAHRNGMSIEEAVRYGGKMRFRPILMTTITTVIGLLPLAFGFGPGADLQQSMAIAIIGGETASTLLLLFVLPVLYIKMMKKRE
ncbi:MAG TPA: efflux RND transporter permease subunit, partial [Calditrichaeota bacterium]|nr:efflux RND transporter permease subunit [Calditrichota bacterium]